MARPSVNVSPSLEERVAILEATVAELRRELAAANRHRARRKALRRPGEFLAGVYAFIEDVGFNVGELVDGASKNSDFLAHLQAHGASTPGQLGCRFRDLAKNGGSFDGYQVIAVGYRDEYGQSWAIVRT